MKETDDLRGQCVCGCEGAPTKCTGLDLGPVRIIFDFTLSEATELRSLMEIALFALREKRVRLLAMEPSWTIGVDDLRMLREATERQMEEAEALLKRIVVHPASEHFTPPRTGH